MELAGKYEWYEVTLAPGGELASQPHDPGTTEHLTVIHRDVELEVGPEKKKVATGGTARYPADLTHIIRNLGKTEAKAVLVVVHETDSRRRKPRQMAAGFLPRITASALHAPGHHLGRCCR